MKYFFQLHQYELEINYRKRNRKRINIQRLNNPLLKSSGSTMKSKRESEKYFETNEIENITFQKCGMQEKHI